VAEIWTIGHSNHSAARFTELLKMHEIDLLVDVRSKPKSRFTHFCRFPLIKFLNAAGIQYLYGGLALGGLSNYSVDDKLFVTKMDTILEHAKSGKRLAMMCSEGKMNECHRAGKLTAWLHRNRQEVKTTHILTNGETVDGREFEPNVNMDVRWPAYATSWPCK
jgi:uncharacterized protein (DUF488 family)